METFYRPPPTHQADLSALLDAPDVVIHHRDQQRAAPQAKKEREIPEHYSEAAFEEPGLHAVVDTDFHLAVEEFAHPAQELTPVVQ